ncbi:MAG: MBL fold metallo-hydrolase [Planctomycetota bacterium]|nr:MAG: MBL fold metallo-hydrolase [Planctomycetota bacterium]
MTLKATLTPLLGNSQKLDGGSMFGNCPRTVWERWSAPDESGRIDLACRALLVEQQSVDGPPRRVLFEAGVGAFFEPRLRERFGVTEPEHVLLDSLASRGLSHEDIDVVVLSHLHFDHAGGLLSAWQPDAEPRLLFPSARFVLGRAAWERAVAPHDRDRASFLPGLNAQLLDSGRLEVVDGERSAVLGEGYRFHTSDGHTPGLLMTELDTAAGPLVFVGDLIPGLPWMHLPITMGYDRFPERLIDEKRALLTDLVTRDGRVFFTHDPACAMARVVQDERGRFAGEPLAARPP